jgi:Holliday junction resolvase RusA-like endonuclease
MLANHDIDNIKGLLDALTGIVWVDDGQINELSLKKGIDRKTPRVEMQITSRPSAAASLSL